MTKLFILGTGFSKAVSIEMGPHVLPTMVELGEHVMSKIDKLSGERNVYKRLMSEYEDVELLLTYLYQTMPWKTSAEADIDMSDFRTLSGIVAAYIAECEEKTFGTGNEPPEWVKQFVQYLHRDKLTVATFNYDTALERLSVQYLVPDELAETKREENIHVSNFYDGPIARLSNRCGNMHLSPTVFETYRLLKLHGSINWYYLGSGDTSIQQAYYSDEIMFKQDSQGYDPYVRVLDRNREDLTHLIIPPVADKSLFYNVRFVGILWARFVKAIEEADEIYCIGYSLPKTDLVTRILFSTVMDRPEKKVYIVNLKSESKELIANYRQVLQKCELVEDYILDESPIEAMVGDL